MPHRSPASSLLALPLLAALGAHCAAGPAPWTARRELTPEALASATAETLLGLAREALSADPALAARATAQLRAAGPRGLEALFEAHGAALAALREEAARSGTVPQDPVSQRLRVAVERVARQRDAHFSRLYWHTDLAAAQREASRTGRPILSLRLLGRLDEELSCANSRYFRTALYPDAAVGARLRERFVLHWSSERPAPRVTIEYGDGRVVQRTITGNSIHYVLDARGRVLDALPGLYSPQAFLSALAPVESAAPALAALVGARFAEALRAFHTEQARAAVAAWRGALVAQAGVSPLDAGNLAPPGPPVSRELAPDVAVAEPIAAPKAIVEMPMVAAVRAAGAPPLPSAPAAPPPWWQALLQYRATQDALTAPSRALMRTKLAPGSTEQEFARRLAAFERSMAEDTVRNEFGLHRQLHAWFVADPSRSSERDALDGRVYTELFLTPRSDPWLGLMPAEAFSGIEGDGIVNR